VVILISKINFTIVFIINFVTIFETDIMTNIFYISLDRSLSMVSNACKIQFHNTLNIHTIIF